MQRTCNGKYLQKAGLCVVLVFTVAVLYGVMRCSTTEDFCALQRKGSTSFARKVMEPDKQVVDRAKCIQATGTKQVIASHRKKPGHMSAFR